MTEIWKDVRGFESFYQVSNLGNVRSLDRTVACSRLGTKDLKGRELKTTVDSAGYCKVTLQNQGRVVRKIHRLVAEHFIDRVEGKEIINHLDNDRTNNKSNNLEWCTPKENTAHMHKQGRNYSARGESNPGVKLTDEDVAKILRLRGSASQEEIGQVFGVSKSQVGRIHRQEQRC